MKQGRKNPRDDQHLARFEVTVTDGNGRDHFKIFPDCPIGEVMTYTDEAMKAHERIALALEAALQHWRRVAPNGPGKILPFGKSK